VTSNAEWYEVIRFSAAEAEERWRWRSLQCRISASHNVVQMRFCRGSAAS